MSKKLAPIQVHNLNFDLHKFIVDGKTDDFTITAEQLVQLSKMTCNSAWLGWYLPSVSRSTRAALMMELAFALMQQNDSIILQQSKTNDVLFAPANKGNVTSQSINSTLNSKCDENAIKLTTKKPDVTLSKNDVINAEPLDTINNQNVNKAEYEINVSKRKQIRDTFCTN